MQMGKSPIQELSLSSYGAHAGEIHVAKYNKFEKFPCVIIGHVRVLDRSATVLV
jgi:hypothetical protein